MLATDGGIIRASAWNWDRFLRRPRWICNHDIGSWSYKLNEAPLGSVVDIGIESFDFGRALAIYVRYAPTKFAQEIRVLYDSGGLSDCSVRWDPLTERTRPPLPAEVERFGGDLKWVCEFAELLEVSSVLYGADPAAQLVRPEVLEAFERCRSKRIVLPHVERLVRQSRPRPVQVIKMRDDTQEKTGDPMAAAELIQAARQTLKGMEECQAVGQTLRQQLAENITALTNLAALLRPDGQEEDPLLMAKLLGGAASTLPAAGVGQEDEKTEIELAMEDLDAALAAYDAATADVGFTIEPIGDALTRLAVAIGLAQPLTQTQHSGLNLNSPVNIPAVAADMVMHRLRS